MPVPVGESTAYRTARDMAPRVKRALRKAGIAGWLLILLNMVKFITVFLEMFAREGDAVEVVMAVHAEEPSEAVREVLEEIEDEAEGGGL